MAGRIRIGEILLNAGVIDQHQLNGALGEQRRWGRPLGATLVKMGFLDERSLVRALASQLSLPVASLEGKRIGAEVLALVPPDIAERHMVLPLFVKKAGGRTTLYLAMEDPGDLAVLDDLAFRTGLQVKPVMMSPSELAEGIDRYYRDAAVAPTPTNVEAEVPDQAGRGQAAVDGLKRDATPPPDAAAPAPAPSTAGGTEELVRHFTAGGEAQPVASPEPAPATQPVASPEPAPATQPVTSPEPAPATESIVPEPAAARELVAAPEPIVAEPSHDAPAPELASASFDESALAAPPPRENADGAVEAPRHPPVESLASYEAKTRTILHVLTQLLIEKGVISREEFHARVSALSSLDGVGPRDTD